MIRELSGDLVHRWKSMYRPQTGQTDTAAPAKTIGSQRLRTMAMFLEEGCYSRVQTAGPYRELIEGVTQRLLEDPDVARNVAIGAIAAVDFVQRVGDDMKRMEVLRQREGLKLKQKL